MDEQLQAKIDEAKANGYSDEEIQQYLATKDQPIAQEQPINRGEEYGASALNVLPTVAEGLGIGYGIKKAAEAFKGAPAATTPIQPGSGADMLKQFATPKGPVAPVTNPAVSPSYAAPSAQAPVTAPSQVTAAQSIVQKLALDKVLKGAGMAAGAYQLGQGLFGTSEDEIRIMKEAEARKRAQGWKPMNER